VLDACVLYPAPLRDLLLSLAAGGMFAARWSEQIQEEWIQNLLAKRPELDSARLRRTANLMCEAVEDCLIDNFEHLITSLTLPAPTTDTLWRRRSPEMRMSSSPSTKGLPKKIHAPPRH
jgi:hypothetical protein